MRGNRGSLKSDLSVVEPVIVNPRHDLLAHVADVSQSRGLVLGRAQAELCAVGGSVEQLLRNVGEDGGCLLHYGGVAQRLADLLRENGLGA
jgi:hypothetical protein